MIEDFMSQSPLIKVAAILLIPYLVLSVILWIQECEYNEVNRGVLLSWGIIAFISALLCFISAIFNI